MMVNQPEIDYDTEAALLRLLSDLHGGPWECAGCRRLITPLLGWKPEIAFILGESGVWRTVVDILCGECVGANRHGWHLLDDK